MLVTFNWSVKSFVFFVNKSSAFMECKIMQSGDCSKQQNRRIVT